MMDHYDSEKQQHVSFLTAQETKEKQVDFLNRCFATIMDHSGTSGASKEIRFMESMQQDN